MHLLFVMEVNKKVFNLTVSMYNSNIVRIMFNVNNCNKDQIREYIIWVFLRNEMPLFV